MVLYATVNINWHCKSTYALSKCCCMCGQGIGWSETERFIPTVTLIKPNLHCHICINVRLHRSIVRVAHTTYLYW